MTNKKLHKFKNNPDQWYVEEPWADDALFRVMQFRQVVYDPFCGGGNIPKAAERAGYTGMGTDIADRGYGPVANFFATHTCPGVDVVSNPPYNRLSQAIDHALAVTDSAAKIAMFTRLSFLCSEKRYQSFTEHWPLAAVLVCSKRVNCLPGANLLAGEKPGGGAIDYCWLIFDKQLPPGKLPILGFLLPDDNEVIQKPEMNDAIPFGKILGELF